MADVQSNIQVSIDTTQALASIKNLQRQISAFHTSMAQSGAAANAVTGQMQQNLINSINATGKFSAQMRTIKTTTESFTDSLQKNKFSLGEYFRYAGGASKSFGRLFKTEFETINKVARENVKDLQTQYIKMGRDASGAMKAIAVRPLSLDMNDLATKTMIASEKQALLNQLLKQGSTNLLNFGKNTQWAGRQLMVGFTIPLMAAGTAAAKSFMDMEKQAIRFKKVYGDLFTSTEESTAALENIKELGKSLTQYGIAVADTVGVASEAAAAGFAGVDLQRQTEQSIRLSILGQVDYQKALETTISVQNAFGISSDQLAESIDFLNAVENQTVVSLDDITTAIPKVAPVIKQLGGDVKDLAFLMTAMKEGGINASEGANALKSGLASMINPTGKAAAMLESFGINIKKIVVDNKGDLKKTVVEFATALNELDPLNRAQAIEQMFGKFQFARLSTLFANVTKEGTQAARVLDLAGSSVQELANLSEKELGMTAESSMNKFKKAVEDLKLALVPVGEEFLKAVTPVAQFVADILEKFNGLSAGTKKIIVTITAIVAGLGPVFLMTFGLLANGLANIIKGFTFLKTIFNKAGQSTATLGTEVKYMTLEQRNAAAVAASLDQVHKTLAQTFTAEASAVDALTRAYQRSIAAQAAFVPTGAPMGRGPVTKVTKRSTGKPAVVGGTGNKDTELALLTPGETVIPADMSDKYGFLINGMIADNIPGYIKGKKGRAVKPISERTQDVPIYGDLALFFQDSVENQSQRATAPALEQVLAPLVTRVAEARGLGFSQQTQVEHYPGIIEEYTPTVQTFVDNLKAEMDRTADTITSESERLGRAWQVAGRSVEEQLNTIPDEVERGRVRQALGVDPDSYGSVAGNFRDEGSWGGRTARYTDDRSPISFTDRRIKKGTRAAFKMITGKDAPAKTDMGHVFDLKTREKIGLPTTVPLQELLTDPSTKPSVVAEVNRSIAQAEVDSERKAAEKAARNRTVGQATETTEQAVTAVRKTAKTASPSKRTVPVGEDIARGLTEGMKKETPKVVSEANKMTDSAINATRTRTRRSASRPQGAPTPSGSEVVATAPTRGQRGYRSSSRPQGPSNNIGPLMPSGATSLSLIGLTAQERRQIDKERSREARTANIKSRAKSIGGRVNSFGGGMGLLGANMGLSMLPDFAGKGIAQGGLAGANLGMMFGPYGMAAGAVIGSVSTAISGLIEKQKQLKAMNEATFKSSADVATFFGNAVVDTTLKVGSFTNSITSMSTSTANAGKSFGYTNEELDRFLALVGSLPENNPLKQLVDGLGKEDNPRKVMEIANAFIATQVAIGQLKPEQAQKQLDLLLASSGNLAMVGSTFVNFRTQVQATVQMLKNAEGNSVALGNSLVQLTGAAANSSSLTQLTGIIDGIAAAGISGAAALTSMYNAYLLMGNTEAATGVKILRNVTGITGEQTAFLIAAAAKGFSKKITSKTTADELVKEAQTWLDKNQDRIFKKTSGANDITKTKAYKDQEKESSGLKKQIDLLKKKKKIIDDQIKQQEKITNELKRQNDYLDKQRDLDQQIVDAKVKGNYIEAASLLQEKNQNTVEFNQETQKSKLQEQSDLLQAQIDALELENSKVIDAINKSSANQAAATAAAASSIVDAIKGGYSFNSGARARRNRSGQPFAVTTTPAPENVNRVGGPTVNQTVIDPKTGKRVMLQEGNFSDKLSKYANSQNWKIGDVLYIGKDGDIPAIITNDTTKPKRTGSIEVTAVDQNTGVFQYRVKAARGGYIQGFEPGGKVSGPGTSTSDSIPALLSDGEYVFSARAVENAGGPEAVDGWHKALRRANGGPVGKNKFSIGKPDPKQSVLNNFLFGQKYVGGNTNITKGEVPFGPGGISNIIAKLGYKPINLINQYMNYFKAKGLLKKGMYHGSADLGSNSDGPFKGVTELSGDYARDPYHGMGFYATSSKSEADMYAGGYNVPGQWGEAYGSLNKVTKLPFGRYLDFTKDLKKQNYGLWKLLGDNGFMGAQENLGTLMNNAGMTGSIMPRISAGLAPSEMMLAKWIALNKPKGTILEEIGLGFAKGGPVGGAPHGLGMSSMGSSSPSLKPKKATSLFDKSIWEKTANFFGLPEMAKTGFDVAKYGGPAQMMTARLFGAPMKSSLGDNATTALNVVPIPVAKMLRPSKNLLQKALNKTINRFASGNVSPFIANRVLGSQFHGGPSGLTSEIMKKQDLNMWNFPGTYLTANKFSAANYADAARGPQGSSLYSFKAKTSEKINILNMAKKATDEQKEAVLRALTGGKPLHGTSEMQDALRKAIDEAKSLDDVLYLARAYPSPKGIQVPLTNDSMAHISAWRQARNKRIFSALGITGSDTDLVTNLMSTKTGFSYKIRGAEKEFEKLALAEGYVWPSSTLRGDDLDQNVITNMMKFISSESKIDNAKYPGANKKVQEVINSLGALNAGATYAPTSLSNWLNYFRVLRKPEIFDDPSGINILHETMLHNIGPTSPKLLQMLKDKVLSVNMKPAGANFWSNSGIRTTSDAKGGYKDNTGLNISNSLAAAASKSGIPQFAKGGLIRNKISASNYSLPSYDVGSPYIPEDQIAQLHKGERVLTAQENKNFSNPGPVTNNITINGADKDPKQIAQEVMIQLERMQSKNNKTNLVGR